MQVIIDSTKATVTWTPPLLSPGSLAEATYKIYGLNGDVEEPLTTSAALSVFAEVELGYESYAVAVVIDGVESAKVRACLTIKTNPPRVIHSCEPQFSVPP